MFVLRFGSLDMHILWLNNQKCDPLSGQKPTIVPNLVKFDFVVTDLESSRVQGVPFDSTIFESTISAFQRAQQELQTPLELGERAKSTKSVHFLWDLLVLRAQEELEALVGRVGKLLHHSF